MLVLFLLYFLLTQKYACMKRPYNNGIKLNKTYVIISPTYIYDDKGRFCCDKVITVCF